MLRVVVLCLAFFSSMVAPALGFDMFIMQKRPTLIYYHEFLTDCIFLLPVVAAFLGSLIAVVWGLLRVVAIRGFQNLSFCIVGNLDIARSVVERSQHIMILLIMAASYAYVFVMFCNWSMCVAVRCLVFFRFHACAGARVLCFHCAKTNVV